MSEMWTTTPDRFQGDLAIGPLYADRPPTRGIAGWTDWLLDNPIANALQSGRVKAASGEQFLIAGRPPMGATRLLFIGCDHFPASDELLEALAGSYATTIENLGGRRILVEVPAEKPDPFLRMLSGRVTLPASAELYAYIPEVPCRI